MVAGKVRERMSVYMGRQALVNDYYVLCAGSGDPVDLTAAGLLHKGALEGR